MSHRLARPPWSWSRASVALALVVGYLALRALNLGELWFASSSQAASGAANPLGRPNTYFVHSTSAASPGLSGVLANWDGQWYERIATDGYPTAREARSDNDRWTWAFPPLFPMAARLVMAITGLGFPAAALLLNLVLGGVATALLYGLLRRCVGSGLAVAAALSLNVFVSAPLFGLAYSEPAALVILLATLWATVARRYWVALASVILLAFTRPVAAPLAAVFVAHWVMLWRSRRRSTVNWTTHVMVAVCAIASLASPFLWNAVAGRLSGSSGGRSESANGALSGVSRASSMLSTFEFGWFGGLARTLGVGGVIALAVTLTVVLLLVTRAARHVRWPPELTVWGIAYTAFVVLVTPLTPGILRYLLLAAPLLVGLHVVLLTWGKRLAGLVAFGVVAAIGLWSQWVWIRYLYILDPAPALLPWAP
ncbi:hypothetical protein GCM10027039_29110 [Terrabacter koreensis]